VKCAICRKDIGSGEQARRRAEYRRQPDGSVKVFGRGMPDGELSEAAGQLTEVRHNGCYWAEVKRMRRAG
jgi:hypothetical protein